MTFLQDLIIMKQAKYDSRSSFRLSQAQDVQIRSRNLSLGSNLESRIRESSLSPSLVKQVSQVVYLSRKNRSIMRGSKFKISKFASQNTKICQQSISQYFKLKQIVKQNSRMDLDYSPTKLQQSPKLKINNLEILHQYISKNRSYVQRKHLKAELNKQSSIEKINRNELMPVKLPIYIKKYSQRYSIQLPAKKYNQFTLREIAEVNEGPKFNILMKLKQMKIKQASKHCSRRPSDDYSLEGW